MSGKWVIQAVVAALVVSAWAVPASAQNKRKVIRLEEINVEGRIQKPQAFYILPRSSLNYEALKRDDTFLPKIERSLEKEPF